MRSLTGKVTQVRLKDKLIDLLHHANTEAEGFEPESFDEVWVRDESGKLVRQEADEDDVKEGQ